jgi:hypothetical protein
VAAALIHSEAEYDLTDLPETIYGIHVLILADDPEVGMAIRDVLPRLPQDFS